MFVLLGCKNDHQITIGSYKSVIYNKFDFVFLYLFKGINSAFVEFEINLKNDSSFVYTTCGNIMKGSYYVKNDSLFFKCEIGIESQN